MSNIPKAPPPIPVPPGKIPVPPKNIPNPPCKNKSGIPVPPNFKIPTPFSSNAVTHIIKRIFFIYGSLKSKIYKISLERT